MIRRKADRQKSQTDNEKKMLEHPRLRMRASFGDIKRDLIDFSKLQDAERTLGYAAAKEPPYSMVLYWDAYKAAQHNLEALAFELYTKYQNTDIEQKVNRIAFRWGLPYTLRGAWKEVNRIRSEYIMKHPPKELAGPIEEVGAATSIGKQISASIE